MIGNTFNGTSTLDSSRMEEKDVVQCGHTLNGNFGFTNNHVPFATKLSSLYVISGVAHFQIKIIVAVVKNGSYSIYNNLIFIKFLKASPNDSQKYMIKFSSPELGIIDKCFTSDDGTWHLVSDNNKLQVNNFNVSIRMETVPCANSFATLHEDNELTDFELRGEDGSVQVHRAVLAASSSVLRTMLSGTWKETREGFVDVPGTSRTTLQHFKDYVYLHTLPDTGLEQVLLLASYYMMPDFEQQCTDKLVSSLTAQNVCDLLEFAVKHKVTRLLLAILQCVQNRQVNVNEMREHLQLAK